MRSLTVESMRSRTLLAESVAAISAVRTPRRSSHHTLPSAAMAVAGLSNCISTGWVSRRASDKSPSSEV